MSDPFIKSLRELDSAFGEQKLSPQKDAEIRQQLREPTTSGPWQLPFWRRPSVLAFTCLLLLVSIFSSDIFSPTSKAQHLGGFLIVKGSASLAPANAVRCLSNQCQLQFVERRIVLKLRKKAQVRRENKHLQLLKGETFFNVSPRREKETPLRVHVSHGFIEVIGTQFTLWQEQSGGSLHLHEGSIRFVQNDGLVRFVKGAGKLRWPFKKSLSKPRKHTLPRKKASPSKITPRDKPTNGRRVRPLHRRKKSSTRPQTRTRRRVARVLLRKRPALHRRTKPQAPTHRKKDIEVVNPQRTPDVQVSSLPLRSVPPPPRLDIASQKVIKEAARLRLRQKYEEAVRLLQNYITTLSSKKDGVREILHYEIGQYLTDYLKQKRRACWHWKQHLQLFSHSLRYKEEVEYSLKRLRCPSSNPF